MTPCCDSLSCYKARMHSIFPSIATANPFRAILRFSLRAVIIAGLLVVIPAILITTVVLAATLSAKDKTFMTNIAHRGFEELAMVKLAERQVKNPDLMIFAKQVMLGRSAINDEVISLAARKDSPIKKENLGTVIGHNPKLGALAWGAGYAGPGGVMSNYDKRWASEMETALRNDLTDCADEAKNGDDTDLKGWAPKAFEEIRKYLLTLMDIEKKLK
jgi:putative membrane protein